jgi:hypothetical protein
MKKGDIITDFDGEHVRSARHLSRLVAETPEGRTVKTAVLREGKRVDLSVTPESGTHAGRRIEREFEFKVPPPDVFAGRPGDDEMMGPGLARGSSFSTCGRRKAADRGLHVVRTRSRPSRRRHRGADAAAR